MNKPRLVEADFAAAARKLQVPIPAVKAVAEVEARGGGFLPSGEPKILFEAHIFHRQTGGRFTEDHPDLSSRRWNRKLYAGGQKEHERLARAAQLDRSSALQSASWGMFQIMGFNWKLCGYASLQDFVNDMYRSEAGHLNAFVGFMISARLDDLLRKLDWRGFARNYNGPSFRENRYDEKLEAAFRKFSSPSS